MALKGNKDARRARKIAKRTREMLKATAQYLALKEDNQKPKNSKEAYDQDA